MGFSDLWQSSLEMERTREPKGRRESKFLMKACKFAHFMRGNLHIFTHYEGKYSLFHCHTFFHFTWLRIVIPSLRSHIGKLLYVPSYATWG